MTTIVPEKKKKKNLKREIFEWVLMLLAAVAVAMTIRTFGFIPVKVIGTSMIDTLKNDEIMFVTKLDYWVGDPQRFDVVICRYPNRTENFVKRIVGLPGDTVEVKNSKLIVNGEVQNEPYITHSPDYRFGPYTVPEGQYFVLGDNRSNSNDSHLVGTLLRSQIEGHVRAVIFPFATIRGID